MTPARRTESRTRQAMAVRTCFGIGRPPRRRWSSCCSALLLSLTTRAVAAVHDAASSCVGGGPRRLNCSSLGGSPICVSPAASDQSCQQTQGADRARGPICRAGGHPRGRERDSCRAKAKEAAEWNRVGPKVEGELEGRQQTEARAAMGVLRSGHTYDQVQGVHSIRHQVKQPGGRHCQHEAGAPPRPSDLGRHERPCGRAVQTS